MPRWILYNLYIIAADMENENTGSHTFDFNQYFQGEQADDARVVRLGA